MSDKKRLLVFASGTAIGGGSGFDNLAASAKAGELDAEIVAVVSQHPVGGVNAKAHARGVQFIHFPGPWNEAGYRGIVDRIQPDFIALSGWTKLTKGLDPSITVSIHPGPLPKFGGRGMYGMAVHSAVIAAFRRGEILNSELCMHFVTDEYDRGPIIFRAAIGLDSNETEESLAAKVRYFEKIFQPVVLQRLLNGSISWDGSDGDSLRLPDEWFPL
jgi:phosphoribosylglycinamide formyltransferase 1